MMNYYNKSINMQQSYNPKNIKGYNKSKKYTIISTEWNEKYVQILEQECIETLKNHWIKNIHNFKVPWSLELPYWALKAANSWSDIVIVIWTVIRWETSHYDHVCDWVTKWIIDVQLKTGKPVIFGILTCDNEDQVKERLCKWKQWALSAISISKI